MCPILDGYGVMTAFSSSTRPRVNRVCHQSVLLISTLERELWRAGNGGVGWVHNRATTCVAGGGIFENQL
jgi:hypothetical protein